MIPYLLQWLDITEDLVSPEVLVTFGIILATLFLFIFVKVVFSLLERLFS